MPHLSPMSWINTYVLVWTLFTIVTLMSWWKPNVFISTPAKLSGLTNLSAPW